jgi:lipoprotein-anchoring transpeptidase ErfK/SrfK
LVYNRLAHRPENPSLLNEERTTTIADPRERPRTYVVEEPLTVEKPAVAQEPAKPPEKVKASGGTGGSPSPEEFMSELYRSRADESRYHVIVWGPTQKAYLVYGHKVIDTYTISTGKNGFGESSNSWRTPRGLLEVSDIAGSGMPKGTIFKSATPVYRGNEPSIADISTTSSKYEKGLMTSRIVILDGVERSNGNTRSRGIYLHGTQKEGLLGTQDSHGCIRFANDDIITLADNYLSEGSKVYVYDGRS